MEGVHGGVLGSSRGRQFYEKQKNYKAAKIYYQAVADDFRHTSWSVKALNKIREISKKE